MLLSLAIQRFGTIHLAEKLLIDAATTGGTLHCGIGMPLSDWPDRACPWGEMRTIRADLLRWICTSKEARDLLTPFGVRIRSARIRGNLDLSFATIDSPLELVNCWIPDGIDVTQASFPALNFSGSRCGHIEASGLHVSGLFQVTHGRLLGRLHLVDARIGGTLELTGTIFHGEQAGAEDTNATDTDVEQNPPYALAADRATIGGSANLGSCISLLGSGAVRFPNCKIGGQLFCGGAKLQNPKQVALHCNGAIIDGGVFLTEGFHACGSVRIIGATINQGMDCSAATFENPAADGIVLAGDRMNLSGNLMLNQGFVAKGKVNFHRAKINGQLQCDQSHFLNPGCVALVCQGILVSGQVIMERRFIVEGSVHLDDAVLEQHLFFRGSQFTEPNTDNYKRRISIQAQGIRVQGHIFFDRDHERHERCQVDGIVLLQFGSIGGGIDFTDARFSAPYETGVLATGLQCAGPVRWSSVITDERTVFDISHATAHRLFRDSENSSKFTGHLIDGLKYTTLTEVPITSGDRAQWVRNELSWIRNQGRRRYASQPYSHLAQMLRASGHEQEARTVLIAQQDDLRNSGGLNWSGAVWNRFLSIALLHGYSLLRPVVAGILFILVGTSIFGLSQLHTNDANAHPLSSQSPFWLSLDAFLPIVSFGLAGSWHPTNDWVLTYYYVHIAAGWLITTLFVVGLSGLVKKA